jgi:hypothetical protein
MSSSSTSKIRSSPRGRAESGCLAEIEQRAGRRDKAEALADFDERTGFQTVLDGESGDDGAAGDPGAG